MILSFWDIIFSGGMLVSGRVTVCPLKIGRAPKGTVCLNQPSIFRCKNLAVSFSDTLLEADMQWSYLLRLRETASFQLNKTKATTKKPLNQKLSIKKFSIFSMPSMFPCYMHTVCIYIYTHTYINIYTCTIFLLKKSRDSQLPNFGQHFHPTFSPPKKGQVTKSRYKNPCSNKGNSKDVMSTIKNGSSKPSLVEGEVVGWESQRCWGREVGSWNPTIIPTRF